MSEYCVKLTDEAKYQYAAIESTDDFTRVTKAMQHLKKFAKMGVVYDPIFEAAPAPEGVRVVYAGHYGVYYLVRAEEVLVVSVSDQRRNPRDRFIFTD